MNAMGAPEGYYVEKSGPWWNWGIRGATLHSGSADTDQEAIDRCKEHRRVVLGSTGMDPDALEGLPRRIREGWAMANKYYHQGGGYREHWSAVREELASLARYLGIDLEDSDG